MILSLKYIDALDYASRKHANQTRKVSPALKVPYISHPMAVSAMVLEYGGSEDEAIGALLHDVVEDCGVTPHEIDVRFGRKVMTIVVGCSDCVGGPDAVKPEWRERKEEYLNHLCSETDRSTLLVSACDKLHNLRCTNVDIAVDGFSAAMAKFRGGAAGTVWYFSQLAGIYRSFAARPDMSLPAKLVRALEMEYEALRMAYDRHLPGYRQAVFR